MSIKPYFVAGLMDHINSKQWAGQLVGWFGVKRPCQHCHGHVEPVGLSNHTFTGQA